MAQRRMFSRKITESDQFLDMPMSAQCLYFHVNMCADDDGFVGNVKTVRRMLGASEDDLKLLIAKEYLLPFESGVVVVRDWKIHNYIQKDRYTETFYKKEKAQIEEGQNKEYYITSDMDTKCIQNVSNLYPQDRIGKSKDREEIELGHHQEQDQQVLSDVLQFYQQNFGVLSSYVQEDLSHWCNDLSAELVIKAMQLAIDNNKQYSYAKGIMQNWLKKNFKTLADVEAEKMQHERQQQAKQKQQSSVPYQRNKKEDVVPYWMKQQQANNQPTQPVDDPSIPSAYDLKSQISAMFGGNE